MLSTVRRWVPVAAGLLVFAIALRVLRTELHGVSWHQLSAAVARVRPSSLGLAVILTALGILILDKQTLDGGHIAILVATLLASWTFTNLVYAFHYARLYYSPGSKGDHGGLAFPGGGEPEFSDFVNFAFVIGMTCQTADIEITAAGIEVLSEDPEWPSVDCAGRARPDVLV